MNRISFYSHQNAPLTSGGRVSLWISLYLRSIGQSFDMSFLNDDVFKDRPAHRIQVFFPPFLQSSVNTLHQFRVLVGFSAISALFFHS